MKKHRLFFSILMLAVAIMACTFSFPWQNSPSPSPRLPSDTAEIPTSISPQVGLTSAPTLYQTIVPVFPTESPTSPPSPSEMAATATPSPNAQKIEFAPGADSILIQSEVAGNSQKEYILYGSQGQTISVDVQSPNFDVFLGIVGKTDGVTLISPTVGATNWSGVLPSSQEYLIQVVSEVASTGFTMRIDLLPFSTPPTTPVSACLQTYIVKRGDYLVDIARRFGVDWRAIAALNRIEDPSRIYPGQVLCIPSEGTLLPSMTPLVSAERQRIRFAAGATSATVEGDISPGEVKEYVLRALQSQWMMVNLGMPIEGLKIAVYGLSDGNYLVKASEGRPFWQGALPVTQDYVVQLISEGVSSHYYLTVTIPVRIQFQPGAYSATIEGMVQGRAVNYYILRAKAEQTMSVKIASPKSDVLLTIYGVEDGSPLVRYVSGATEWEGKLPATQDYIIEAVSVGETTSYTLQVTIR